MMAAAALAGIDPMLFLKCEDEVELALLSRVANKAIELDGIYRQDLANRVIQALSKAMEKGAKQS